MKVFVATKETQGQRTNDFCFVPENEIVIFGFECDSQLLHAKATEIVQPMIWEH